MKDDQMAHLDAYYARLEMQLSEKRRWCAFWRLVALAFAIAYCWR